MVRAMSREMEATVNKTSYAWRGAGWYIGMLSLGKAQHIMGEERGWLLMRRKHCKVVGRSWLRCYPVHGACKNTELLSWSLSNAAIKLAKFILWFQTEFPLTSLPGSYLFRCLANVAFIRGPVCMRATLYNVQAPWQRWILFTSSVDEVKLSRQVQRQRSGANRSTSRFHIFPSVILLMVQTHFSCLSQFSSHSCIETKSWTPSSPTITDGSTPTILYITLLQTDQPCLKQRHQTTSNS